MKRIYILNPRAPKKAKICQIYPPSSQSGSLHFVLHLYWFVIYQSEDLDFRISKIGTKCEKNWKEQKKEPKGTKKSQNYNFLPKNEKVSTSVSHWSSLWYIKSKILPWLICRSAAVTKIGVYRHFWTPWSILRYSHMLFFFSMRIYWYKNILYIFITF